MILEGLISFGSGYAIGSTLRSMTDEVKKNKYNDNYIPSFLPVSPFMIVGKMVYALYKSKCHK